MTLRAVVVCTGLSVLAGACRAPAEPDAAEHVAIPGAEDRSAENSDPASLTLATWNIEWLNRQNGKGPKPRTDADYARLQHYAVLLDADVVALQEIDGEQAAARVFAPSDYKFHFAASGGAQRSGFAYRKTLDVTVHDDFLPLDLGGTVRAGADISVRFESQSLRLLGVHLKSGCFESPLDSGSSSCTKLSSQNELLEEWIDERAASEDTFAVLGDFNRRLNGHDPFYQALDDSEPAGADLTLVTSGKESRCWGGKYPEFIDHVVLGKQVTDWWQTSSFEQIQFEGEDADGDDYVLSDHCPIRVVLWPDKKPSSQPPTRQKEATAQPLPEARETANASPAGLIKGNISSRGKLYHLPNCPGYAVTRIDPAKGERWFSSEAEATAAGWRLAGNCTATNR